MGAQSVGYHASDGGVTTAGCPALPAEGVGELEHSIVDTGIDVGCAVVRDVVKPVLELDGASLAVKQFDSRPEVECEVERACVGGRDGTGGESIAYGRLDERLH